jgi:UDP-2,4-diacetamido-2,4,6-trideoxy-beta-L-altropyranose hydrolase
MTFLKVKIYFRADASSNIGLGHITRCLGIADMLKKSYKCFFFIRETDDSIIQLIENKGYEFHTLKNGRTFQEEAETLCLNLSTPCILVLDGYSFNERYQEILIKANIRLVSIVDISNGLFLSHVIINHSIGAEAMSYKTALYTRKYLGLKYALIRQEFIVKASDKFVNSEDLLICFGGTDVNNLTKKIADMLIGRCSNKINIIIGRAFAYKKDLDFWAEDYKERVSIFYDLSESDVIQIMKQSGIAVLSASSIAIEYLSITNGKLFLMQTADNQQNFYENALKKKLAFPFERFAEKDLLEWNHDLQNEIFDGKQVERIINIFNTLAYECKN